MIRSAATTRSTFLKLKTLTEGKKQGEQISVRFSSSVVSGYRSRNSRKHLLGKDGVQAYFEELATDTLTVSMQALPEIAASLDYKLVIPLEFVKAVWREPRQNMVPLLSLALDAEIRWNGTSWIINTTDFD